MLDVTQDRLKSLFNYERETGEFICKAWRGGTARAGSVAGSLNKGYLLITIDGKRYRAHRLAWLYVHGCMPKEIDHINGNRSDNRIINLRNVTRSENSKNHCVPSNNKSGVMGVYWNKAASKWQAYIKLNGKPRYLGVFADKFDAICSRKSAEYKLGFHENHGRMQVC